MTHLQYWKENITVVCVGRYSARNVLLSSFSFLGTGLFWLLQKEWLVTNHRDLVLTVRGTTSIRNHTFSSIRSSTHSTLSNMLKNIKYHTIVLQPLHWVTNHFSEKLNVFNFNFSHLVFNLLHHFTTNFFINILTYLRTCCTCCCVDLCMICSRSCVCHSQKQIKNFLWQEILPQDI